MIEQIKGWRDEAQEGYEKASGGSPLAVCHLATLRTYNRVLALLDGAEVIKEEDVLAEAGANAYVRGEKAYAEVGSGMVRLDSAEGVKGGERLRVLVLQGESDES